MRWIGICPRTATTRLSADVVLVNHDYLYPYGGKAGLFRAAEGSWHKSHVRADSPRAIRRLAATISACAHAWERPLVAAAVVMSAAVTFLFCRELRHDDAYVTFVYARHLGAGEGFVFNLGERVLGTTSPLQALLLALVYRLFGEVLPTAALLIGSLGLSLQGAALYGLVREHSRGLAILLVLLLWAGMAGAQPWLTLETNLFCALVLATLYAQHRHYPGLCGLGLGLAFLCRYDGALLIPVLIIQTWRQRRAFPQRALLVAFAVVAPWLIGATLYFGTFLPQTLGAKQAIVTPLAYLGHYLHYFAAEWLDRFLPNGWSMILAPVGWLFGLVTIRRLPQLQGLFLFSLLLLGSYAVIGPPPPQHWHMYPVTLTAGVVLALAVLTGLQQLGRRWPAVFVAVGLLLVMITGRHTVVWSRTIGTEFWLGHRHHCYEVVADWIKANVLPDQVFMAHEVGTLGFLTRQRMIDPYGLINETNEFPTTQSPAALAKLIAHYRPTLMLADSPQEGRWLEQNTPLRVVKIFPWNAPWSTLLVSSPGVLRGQPPD